MAPNSLFTYFSFLHFGTAGVCYHMKFRNNLEYDSSLFSGVADISMLPEAGSIETTMFHFSVTQAVHI